MKENECIYKDMCPRFRLEECSEFTCDRFRDYSDFPEFFSREDDIIDEIF